MSNSKNLDKKSRQRVSGPVLMLMTFSAVFNFNSIVNNSAAIGLQSIPAYFFASFFYFLPFSLMVSEMVTANGERIRSPCVVRNYTRTKMGLFRILGLLFVKPFYFVS